MKKLINLSLLTFSSVAFSASSFTFVGEVPVSIKLTEKTALAQDKTVVLPQVRLSAEAMQYLQAHLSHYKPSMDLKLSMGELPTHINLGMQGTPVLDQGMHGSCVTFATAGALDAILGAGDYVSELCSLELGSYLAINDQIQVSGWDGSYGPWVLDQVMKYGIIPQNYQRLFGCAGVKEYPGASESDTGHPMSVSEYVQHSIPVNKVISYESLLRDPESFSDKVNKEALMEKIKLELARGNRLTIGILVDVNVGSAGALGTNKASNDTWMLTPQIMQDFVNNEIAAGHELVLIGYEDSVEVKDDKGFTNKGLFRVRNSWGSQLGDNGDYYISYDYMKFLLLEAQAIRLIKE